MYARIVVGVAKTESAKRAVEVALDLADRYDAELHLVTVFDRGGGGHETRARRPKATSPPSRSTPRSARRSTCSLATPPTSS